MSSLGEVPASWSAFEVLVSRSEDEKYFGTRAKKQRQRTKSDLFVCLLFRGKKIVKSVDHDTEVCGVCCNITSKLPNKTDVGGRKAGCWEVKGRKEREGRVFFVEQDLV